MANEALTGYLQTLFYWTIPESSLATIGACLPTLRPIFHGHSPESILESIRSRILLSSGRSPNLSKAIEIDRQSSTESSVGLKQASEDFGGHNLVGNETTVVALRDMAPVKHAHGDATTVEYDIWQGNTQA